MVGADEFTLGQHSFVDVEDAIDSGVALHMTGKLEAGTDVGAHNREQFFFGVVRRSAGACREA